MAFRSRNYLSTDIQNVEPIVKLWILRLLVPLECHRRFIGKHGIESEELAALFDLTVDADPDDESDTAYNPTAFRTQLKNCYRKAELDASAVALPQPLADNLAQLADHIGLSEVECWILAFAVMLRSYRLLDDTADWLGSELNGLRIYHVLSVLLGFSESDIRQALSSQSTLSQTSLVAMDSHRNSLGRQFDVLSGSFADRLMT
ncbi:MAG: hypothetical protein PHH11_11055 [Methylomonas sp.]|nr:hypothetical protein [Methylomonas sp.]